MATEEEVNVLADINASDVDGHIWEQEYNRTWNVIREDEDGSLATTVANLQHLQKRKRIHRDTRSVRRGIIRHVYLIVDMSRAMEEKDLSPSRGLLTLSLLETFITEFFDQNPISQLGIIVTRNANMEKLTDLGGNPADHIRALRQNVHFAGEPSLQKSLNLAHTLLNHVHRHASREIVVLMGSLTTCDPGNIFDTIAQLKADKVRCSVIGLSASVHVCRSLSSSTGGTYDVIMNDSHYKEALLEHIHPPPLTAATAQSALVPMGFPLRKQAHFAAMCACHPKPTRGGFVCPRCSAVVCDIPADCPVCGLTLVSSPHLARSYHHLFPVQPFGEKSRVTGGNSNASGRGNSNSSSGNTGNTGGNSNTLASSTNATATSTTATATGGNSNSSGSASITITLSATTTFAKCFACQIACVRGESVYVCGECGKEYCSDCDVYIHEVLHNCPGCLVAEQRRQQQEAE